MSNDTVLDADAAEFEFERFVESNDLDVDELEMDDEDRTQFRKQKRRIIKALRSGALTINEDGEPVFRPQVSGDDTPIHFRQRTGASMMASDKAKKGHDVAKTYAVMGDMTKCHPSRFAKMTGADIKTCEAIYALLMD